MKNFVLLATTIILLDRIMKFLALQGSYGSYEKNYGLLFGLLANPQLRWLFVAIMALILIFFLYVASMKEVRRNKLLFLGLILMITGLISNLLDRILYSFIIDFIRLAELTTFNIADISITAGAILIAFNLLRGERKRSRQ